MDEDVRNSVQTVIDDHEFLSWLGVTVSEFEEGRAVLVMPHSDKLTNIVEGSRGTIHGGVTASLVDTASGFALRTTFADPTTPALTTTDLDVTYLRPARSDLTVEAEVVRAGDSMGYTDVTVYGEAPDGERKAVVTGSASYRLFRESR
jgi:uncharacterized protein (TIGR00369 family)